jgi:exopolysaccharide production protein ExoZ
LALLKRRALQSVQACRGAAALLVLLFHATFPGRTYFNYDLLGGFFLFGYGGVDFFFVLSGFIIFWAHRQDIGRPEQTERYVLRRLVRIYPVYWIVVLALVPVNFGAPHGLSDFIILLKTFLLFPQAPNPVVPVAWTLELELLFYAMFGLAIVLPRQYIRPILLSWLSVIVLLYCRTVITAGAYRLPHHIGTILSPYNLEFAMGCATAYLVERFPLSGGRSAVVAGALVFLLCGVSESVMHTHIPRVYSVLIFGPASMLVVWSLVSWERRRSFHVPSSILLVGDASYSIYLTHLAALLMSARWLQALQIPARIGGALSAALIAAFSLGVGILCYLVFERPMLALLRRRTARAAPAPC